MKTNRTGKLLILLFVITFSIGFPWKGATQEQKVIKIGHIYSATGGGAWLAKGQFEGANLAAKEINARGGINGAKIELIVLNDDTNPEKAMMAANRLTYRDNVHMILGTSASSPNYAAQKITEKAKIVQLAPSASAPQLTMEGQEWYFRASLSALYQTKVLVEHTVRGLGLKRFAILHEAASVGFDTTKTFAKDLEPYGLQLLAVEKYESGAMDFSAQLIKIKSINPEALGLFGHPPECARAAVQARELDMNALFMVTTTSVSDDLIDLGGKAVEGAIGTSGYVWSNPKAVVQEFDKKILKEFGRHSEYLHATAYDALNIVAKALEGVKLGLKQETLQSDRAKIREALAQTKNYQGVGGTYSFGIKPGSDRDGLKSGVLVQVKDKQFVVVSTKE